MKSGSTFSIVPDRQVEYTIAVIPLWWVELH